MPLATLFICETDNFHNGTPFNPNDVRLQTQCSITAITTMSTPLQPERNDPAEVTNTERGGIHVPSLPLEVWALAFLQNTDPKHLWIVGRQVCTSWRSEIPKIIAKKYLEDRNMTKIESNCWKNFRTAACLMGHKLGFSHYRGRDRMVFATIEKRIESEDDDGAGAGDHRTECNERWASAIEARSLNINDFNSGKTCHECFDKPGGRRCDLPFYWINIKWDSIDTELSGLEVDFVRGEISFEWEAMLGSFYREAAVLDRRENELAIEAVRWFEGSKHLVASVLLRGLENERALWDHRDKVRRARVKGWHHLEGSRPDFEHKNLRQLVCDWEDRSRAEDRIEKQTWERQFNLNRQMECELGLKQLMSHERDMSDDSWLRDSLFDRYGPAWWRLTPDEKQEFETRCILQWLGRGRVQNMKTEHH